MSGHGSRTLYPFHHGQRQDKVKLDADVAHSVAARAAESRDVNARFFQMNSAQLVAAAKAMADEWRDGGRLFAMGSGGSNCDAARITAEFLHPGITGRPSLPAFDLGSAAATISAIGEDIGSDQIFARQIVVLAKYGDGLIGFSARGDPVNLIAAYTAAKERGLITIGFTGGDEGRIKTRGQVDHCLVVESSSVHRVRECHVAACHILSDLIHSLLADVRAPAARRADANRR